ncbi:hypothetical protein CBR_g437 [Chara braunii]|uniref:Uncharacterized protein n=1 Tax=Chara braunii TaxID=69332 RepID=A0A388KB63_CHABU|nr:hypothetical protein CBR_g437 [Chara braunii]|eukprot:GBG67298.1 hypothetical protein CBR_g437 [Chara braunii]
MQERKEQERLQKEVEERKRFQDQVRAETEWHAEATKAELMAIFGSQFLICREEARREQQRTPILVTPRRKETRWDDDMDRDIEDIDDEIQRLSALKERKRSGKTPVRDDARMRQPAFDQAKENDCFRAESSRRGEEKNGTKIPAGSGPEGLLHYVLEQRAELVALKSEALRKICTKEGVHYCTKRPTIERIIATRVKAAYEGTMDAMTIEIGAGIEVGTLTAMKAVVIGMVKDGGSVRWSVVDTGSSSQTGHRFAPVRYECGEPGDYRNQCPRLRRDGGPRYAGQRGRSLSPRQNTRHHEPRAASEDLAVKHQIEELAASMAAMKEVYDAEKAAKEEKKKKKQEKLERKKREGEEAKSEEEARLAEQRRIARKEEKLRKEEEDRQLLRKELLTELSLQMGQLDESLKRRYERDLRERAKGKQKVVVASSDDEDAYSHESDVDTLSRETERLVITEKRKRSIEKAVGDSPPMETPVKRTAKQRLQLGCCHQPMKKASPRKTPHKTPDGSSFGRSEVKVNGKQCKLCACKRDMEKGVEMEILHLRRWKPKITKHKDFLISILRNKKRVESLHKCNLEVLLRLTGATQDFHKASTTAYLRRLIGGVKENYGWSLNSKVTVKLKFDDRIWVVEVRKLLNDQLKMMECPALLRNHARKGVRIVWEKNPSVATLLHNQRVFSRAEVVTCSYAGFSYPRIGGHVRFRLSELEGIHPLLCNANNVPKLSHPDRGSLLRQEIMTGLEGWVNWRGPKPVIRRCDVEACLTGVPDATTKFLDMRAVHLLKKKLDELVMTPLDRNPGDRLVLCPKAITKPCWSFL